jgi:hypothetical protein
VEPYNIGVDAINRARGSVNGARAETKTLSESALDTRGMCHFGRRGQTYSCMGSARWFAEVWSQFQGTWRPPTWRWANSTLGGRAQGNSFQITTSNQQAVTQNKEDVIMRPASSATNKDSGQDKSGQVRISGDKLMQAVATTWLAGLNSPYFVIEL